jgi:hypothetical protein
MSWCISDRRMNGVMRGAVALAKASTGPDLNTVDSDKMLAIPPGAVVTQSSKISTPFRY